LGRLMMGDAMNVIGWLKQDRREVVRMLSASPGHAGGRYGEVWVGEVGIVGGSKNTERDLEEA